MGSIKNLLQTRPDVEIVIHVWKILDGPGRGYWMGRVTLDWTHRVIIGPDSREAVVDDIKRKVEEML